MARQPSRHALVVGAGPNGLSAAVALARHGWSVEVHEAGATIGGGTRTAPLTAPGFLHDVCSAIHPLAVASPFFRRLALGRHGLRWIQPAPLAHPLPDGSAVLLERSLDDTARQLGPDGPAYRRLFERFVHQWEPLFDEVLAPVHVPRRPLLLARFGRLAARSGHALARGWFRTDRARALVAGLAAHSTIPLEKPPSAAFALVLGIAAHAVGWPIPAGGAQSIADALAAELVTHDGRVLTASPVGRLERRPEADAVVCDVTPRQLLEIAGHLVRRGYRRRLERYAYGPGVFKMDWALSDPIPWRAPECRRAGTVHLGGSLDEIGAWERAAWTGDLADRPFVLLAQPSLFDPSRAPADRHTAWAYCHVPNGSSTDMTAAIEHQIERFAPGFRECVLARHGMTSADLEAHNPNLVGGDISGGANTAGNLAIRATLLGYRTSLDWLYLCSSTTPPGGGVHGMCGYHAGRAVLRRHGPAPEPAA